MPIRNLDPDDDYAYDRTNQSEPTDRDDEPDTDTPDNDDDEDYDDDVLPEDVHQ